MDVPANAQVVAATRLPPAPPPPIIYFRGASSPLSNFHAALFRLDDHVFTTVQQAVVARKAKSSLDATTYAEVCRETNPYALRALSMRITNFDPRRWNAEREEHMFDAYMAKFRQNPQAARLLLSTHDYFLAYASPMDVLWGIGADRGTHPASWRGKNRLGYILMRVREQLVRREHEAATVVHVVPNSSSSSSTNVPLAIVRIAEGTAHHTPPRHHHPQFQSLPSQPYMHVHDAGASSSWSNV